MEGWKYYGSMVSERNETQTQHILSPPQRVRREVCINRKEPGYPGSIYSSIEYIFYLTYFKSEKTTYMTQFYTVSIDHSQVKRKYVLNLNEESHKTPYNENMHNHQLFHEELFFFKIFNTFFKIVYFR